MSNSLEPAVGRGRRPGPRVAAWALLLTALAGGPLGGCATRPDAVAAEAEWTRERTLPSDGRAYRLVERSPERVRLTRELTGDLCTLVLVGRAGANGQVIEVAFEAVPF